MGSNLFSLAPRSITVQPPPVPLVSSSATTLSSSHTKSHHTHTRQDLCAIFFMSWQALPLSLPDRVLLRSKLAPMSSPCLDFSTLSCLLGLRWAEMSVPPPAAAPFLQMIGLITMCVFSMFLLSRGRGPAGQKQVSLSPWLRSIFKWKAKWQRKEGFGVRHIQLKLFLHDQPHNLSKLRFLNSRAGIVEMLRSRTRVILKWWLLSWLPPWYLHTVGVLHTFVKWASPLLKTLHVLPRGPGPACFHGALLGGGHGQQQWPCSFSVSPPLPWPHHLSWLLRR